VQTRALGFQPWFDAGFPHGHNQWISAAGTNWAAMALAYALPESTSKTTTALRKSPETVAGKLDSTQRLAAALTPTGGEQQQARR
jgi:hypothetical protein